ncbi:MULTISPECIES: response regulator [unclassified Methylobacterium]|uniref:response regulator n=1 Tax=unclassified Methylobacterium TaxID=2615210 RepID=UPI00037F5186|nr:MULTISPECIES: response regulator [unclassified Methylobacterium]MBN4097828.1 response regulator [Methylobacterium sp. OT2]
MTSKPRALAGRRVLLVEDDYFIAVDLKSGFEEGGAQVLGPVASVGEALALIAGTTEIDAAVLDINLQDELVYPVADALHARGVPFLFATGYDPVAVPSLHGAVALCQKPIDPEVVARALFG